MARNSNAIGIGTVELPDEYRLAVTCDMPSAGAAEYEGDSPSCSHAARYSLVDMGLLAMVERSSTDGDCGVTVAGSNKHHGDCAAAAGIDAGSDAGLGEFVAKFAGIGELGECSCGVVHVDLHLLTTPMCIKQMYMSTRCM